MLSPTKRREAFLESVDDECHDRFLEFVKLHHSKESDFDLAELFQSLDRTRISSMWDGLFKLCNDTLISSPLEVDEFAEDKDELQQAVNTTIACLDGILTVALCYLQSQEKPVIPQSFEEVTSVLHGVLLDFPKSADKLQNNVARLCELWWSKELPNREEVIKNAFMFLLRRTLENSHFADVKRVYSLRQSLLLHDFGANQSVELKQMLEQCIISPVYLKADEGRRFLSFIFGMNPTFIEQLHKTIKMQIPSCTKTMIKSYAEIYFRAWRAASGPYLEKLEVHCIQDYMYCAVHASRSGAKSMASILKQFMSHFHQQKKHQGVDAMLLRLYEPIIWRALKVANGGVRANAASLLLDAFPLEDPNSGTAKNDELIQKQFDALQSLLEDPCPLVRTIGVQGICRVTSVFWELIPSATVQVLLTKLVREMAYDSASSEVRATVFKGLSFLVSNHLCHGYLNALLPELKNCIHDTAEKVRLAFIELLLKIKGLKSIKFWHIVPMEWLLARMELDSPSIVRRLVLLVFNSFMPSDREGTVQVSRCISLLQMNQLAARRFYQYAHKDMPLSTTVKFMVYLCHTVSAWVKEKQPDDDDDDDDDENDMNDTEEKENESGISDNLSVEIVEGMLETIAILWAAIDVSLQKSENKTLKEKMIKKFSHMLPTAIAIIESSRALSALIMIAGYLPASSLPYFSRSCLSKLKALTKDAKEEYYGMLLDCMCKWCRTSDVFELITDWLKAGFKAQPGAPPSASKSKQKASGKSVKFNEPVQPQPELALKFLTRMMKKTTTRTAVLQGAKEELQEVAMLLKSSMKCIERRLLYNQALSELTSDEFLVSSLCSYYKLQVHLNAENETREDLTRAFGELVTWAGVELIPALSRKPDTAQTQPPRSASKRKAKDMQQTDVTQFATELVQNLLKITNEVILLGSCNCEDLASLTDFCQQLVRTDQSAEFLPVLTRLLYQMTQYCNLVNDDEETAMTNCVVILLGEIVKSLAKFSRKNSDSSASVKELFDSVSALSHVLGCCEQYQTLNPQLRQHIMAPIMTAVVADITNTLRKYPEFLARDSVSELPTLSAFLLGIVCRTKKMISFFVSELQQCVSAGALGTLQHYLAVVHILHALSKGRHTVSNIKDCLLVTQQDLENMEFTEHEEEEGETQERKMFKSTVKLTKETLESIGAVA
ncbi:condensin-2 complex subunit G2-like [Ptychodera flava]|uniref:condensin-2 complex subunit G2-like n=1 Tax=Ptychodera flava TaxID=63121 RepID=UPI00396AA70A